MRRRLALLALAAFAALLAGAQTKAAAPKTATAVFAGGCFWCMEPPFEALPGVLSATSGYTGGSVANPSYQQVSEGSTGHRESVRVEYDPARVSYPRLLEVFWHNIDPVDGGGQFCDRGFHYTSAIFVADAEQRRLAEASKSALEQSGQLKGKIATQILDATAFYPAEDYHQDYSTKNPLRYRYYRHGCGRDARLEAVWGAAPTH